MDLSVREWGCPSCQSINGCDENATKNICAVGASTVKLTVKLGDVRQVKPAIALSELGTPSFSGRGVCQIWGFTGQPNGVALSPSGSVNTLLNITTTLKSRRSRLDPDR
ncbi:hypothetical protein [Microcoleus sp. herbarium2]|uniref:hypothetical protein n=1 Tax=Microcoleus sp. herbarium2 TaxID=3055433 RepID=UPI002FD7067D